MYPAQLGEDTVDVKSASGGWTAVCPYSRSRPRFRDGAGSGGSPAGVPH